MNSSLKNIVLIAILALVSVYCTVDILTTRGSGLGRMLTYVTILCLVISMMRPLLGLYLLLPMSCLLDLVKRFMAVFGTPTETQLAFLMATPLVIIAGATTSIVVSGVAGKRKLKRLHWKILGACIVIAMLSAIGVLAEASGLRSIGLAVNQGVYAFLVFLIPVLLDTTEKRRRYLAFSIPILFFTAIYMIKHSYYGLAQFEIDYLMTGLSQEIRIFIDDGAARRYFSTLNSAGTVCMILSVSATVVFFLSPKVGKAKNVFKILGSVILGGVFYYAASLTLARTGLVCGLFSIVAYFCFGGLKRTVFVYIAGAFMFLIACLTADYIIKNDSLRKWQNVAIESVSSGDVSMERAVTLTTMYDRLSGWDKLTKPWIFPLFGTAFGGEVEDDNSNDLLFSHDFIVTWLAKLGWIPFLIMISFLAWMATIVHRFQFSLDRKSPEFRLVRTTLSAAAGLGLGALTNSAQFMTYPINFYFFLWLAIAIATIIQYRTERAAALMSHRG